MKACQALERFDLQWIEQPLPDWDLEGLAMLAEAFVTPIAVDESVYTVHDVYRIAASRAADVVNVKVANCGGISPSMKIAHAAEAAGIPCFLGGCLEIGVGAAAALQCAACAPNLLPAVEVIASAAFTDDIITAPLLLKGGIATLSDTPGLGVEVDEGKLARYSRR